MSNILPTQKVITTGGLIEATEDVKESRFTATRWPHNAHVFTRINGKRDSLEHMRYNVTHLVTFADVHQLDDGV